MAKAPDHIDLRVNIEYARADTTVHACPPGDCGTMPCCDRTPFEVPPTDRMALDPADVTCGKALDLSPADAAVYRRSADAAIAVMQAPTSPQDDAEGSVGIPGTPERHRATEGDGSNERRLVWFTTAELNAEVTRRLLAALDATPDHGKA